MAGGEEDRVSGGVVSLFEIERQLQKGHRQFFYTINKIKIFVHDKNKIIIRKTET